MKFLHTIFISAAAVMAMSCTGNSSAAEETTFSPDSSATVQAARLVSDNQPDAAARALVRWLANAPASDREFSRELAREVFRNYTTSGDSAALGRFSATLEAEKDSLPLESQVKVFVAVSKPSTLGRMLRNDPHGERLASLIETEYAADSVSVAEFREAYTGD